MVTLTINLRDKRIFFTLFGMGLIYLIYHVNGMSYSLNLTGWDISLFFLIIIATTAMFWIPYQYNEQFT